MLEYEIHGGKGGAETPHTPVETPNNLLSVAYAKVLIAVAEGELAGTPTAKDIYLDGTPLENADGSANFGGVKWEWRPGTVDQTYIQGLPEVSTEYSVGQELKQNTPWTRLITKTQLDGIRFTISTSALLKQKSNGDTVGTTVEYEAQLSTDGGPFVTYQKYKLEGKTNSGYERTHRVDLPEATNNWTIRVVRTTPEDESSTVQDTIALKSYAEVVDVKQTYPNTALLYVEFDSRLFGGGSIPKISVRTKGRLVRVPTNYDPETRTYTGIWNGSFKWAWTDNPAWIYHDIVTNDRFGLGHKVSLAMIDKWALYEVSQYCDVLVDKNDGTNEKEPRHRLNIFIQDQNDAWSVLRDIASVFNGMTYWNGNQFIAIADKEEDISDIPMFSRSNVTNGRFDYQAADDKSIYTSALVSYDDPEDHYNTKVEAAFETSQIIRWGGDRQVELTAIGCTSRSEAQRKAKYTLITNMYNRTVSFQTGFQGMDYKILPGKLIHVLDPLIGGRPYTGRLKVAVGSVLTLDRDSSAKAGDILYITKSNGVTEGRTVQASSGKVVTVTTPYSELPKPNAVWYLEASDLKSQLFRVTKVSSQSAGVFNVDAVEYNESKYKAVDTGARLEPRPISVVPPGIQAVPKNIVVGSRTYVEQTMSVNVMTIKWDQTPNAQYYEVEWKVNDGDWVQAGITGSPYMEVKGIYTGNYIARVRAINPIGIKSLWGNSDMVPLNGKTGLPPTLAYLNTEGMLFGIRLDWGFPEGAEDTLFTEIMYGESEFFDAAIKLGDFAYPRDSHEMHGLKAGQRFFFWGRLVDRSGNVGEWKPLKSEIGVQGMSLINDNGQYNDYFAGLISETALDKDLYDRIELIDGPATLPGSVNNRLEEAVSDLQEQISNIEDALVYDPDKVDGYKAGDIVRMGNKLYQAIKDAPQGIAPPDPDYWKDIGVILEEANGLVMRVEKNEEKIEEIDGVVTATAQSMEVMQAKWRDEDGDGDLRDALNGWNNRAAIIEERTVRASADEAFAQQLVVISADFEDVHSEISTLQTAMSTADAALAERIDKLEVQVGDDLQASIREERQARIDGDTALATRIDQMGATITTETGKLDAKIITEQTVRANADVALGTRIDQLSATMTTENGKLDAKITSEATARAQADQALGTRIDTVQAGMVTMTQVNAAVQSEATARATADTALGKRIDTVQATAAGNTAAIQTVQTAQATTDGKVNTSWTVKMEANAQGQYVAAGIALGIGNQAGLLQSQFLVRADRFAVVNGTNKTTTAPFVVSGGQVFISSAVIADGMITNAMIGNVIQSTNFVSNSTGWQINKNGTFQMNGNVAGQGRINITNTGVKVYHTNGRLAIDLGINV